MKIAYISSYPPRECGIATFNHNLLRAIGSNKKAVSEESFVVAMNDSDSLDEYEYPKEVKCVIRQENQKDYIRAADYINTSLANAC
ncbi:MAG TPA: glycosyl transferase, partial [Pedobacter sp.]